MGDRLRRRLVLSRMAWTDGVRAKALAEARAPLRDRSVLRLARAYAMLTVAPAVLAAIELGLCVVGERD